MALETEGSNPSTHPNSHLLRPFALGGHPDGIVMLRWIAPALICLMLIASTGCGMLGIGGGGGDDALAIAELVLRVGEGTGTEVQMLPGELPPGLDVALNPNRSADSKDPKSSLPVPPESTLRGSGRVAKPDGSITFFVMYEVPRDEQTVADAMRGLLDETPWQVMGGRTGEGVSAYQFQSTRSETVTGTMIVQPLPTTDTFEVIVSRGGKQTNLTLRRYAFVPVLGAELDDRDGGVVVTRVVPGEAATSGLREGDRIVKAVGKDVKDTASLQAALRSLGTGKTQRTGLVYIVQVAPEEPIARRYDAPEPRSLPASFPAPYLLVNGLTPIAVRWTTSPQGSQYEVTLITKQSLQEVVLAYRQALRAANAQIGNDRIHGTAAVIEFTAADSRSAGALSIEVFDQDTSYTAVMLQVQSTRAGAPAGGGAPSPVPSTPVATPSSATPPPGTPAPGATPAR